VTPDDNAVEPTDKETCLSACIHALAKVDQKLKYLAEDRRLPLRNLPAMPRRPSSARIPLQARQVLLHQKLILLEEPIPSYSTRLLRVSLIVISVTGPLAA
jgi:hypothetical protein